MEADNGGHVRQETPPKQMEGAMRRIKKHPLYRVVAALVAALTLVTSVPLSWAASHREAPLIALDPAADNTDTYAFRSWEDPSKVVFILYRPRCGL